MIPIPDGKKWRHHRNICDASFLVFGSNYCTELFEVNKTDICLWENLKIKDHILRVIKLL